MELPVVMHFGSFTEIALARGELECTSAQLESVKYELYQATMALHTREEMHRMAMDELMSTCSATTHSMRKRLEEFSREAQEEKARLEAQVQCLETDLAASASSLREAKETVARLESAPQAKSHVHDDLRLCEAQETIRHLQVRG